LECRSQVKEDLEAGKPRGFETILAVQARGISTRANRSNELRPIDRESEIDADRTDGSRITEADSNSVGEVVQLVRAVIQALQGIGRIEDRLRWRGTKGDASQAAVDVASIVEECAA